MFKEKTSSDYADFYTRRNVPAKWTYGELESKIVENLENWNEEKKSVFVGFIDIWWTLAILFQMMTLDQWADTFKQVQTAHFGPILVSADKLWVKILIFLLPIHDINLEEVLFKKF